VVLISRGTVFVSFAFLESLCFITYKCTECSVLFTFCMDSVVAIADSMERV
jgi:hypothetical protein